MLSCGPVRTGPAGRCAMLLGKTTASPRTMMAWGCETYKLKISASS
jgi:hypothetical protein